MEITDLGKRSVGRFILEVFLVSIFIATVFVVGYYSGLKSGLEFNLEFLPVLTPTPTPPGQSPTDQPEGEALKNQIQSISPKITWGGPELWEALNERRQQLGVNPLRQENELCIIASLRLNELLELEKLDAHKGFANLTERRPDVKWIFEKYNLYEFLISGAKTPQEAVAQWEHTLAHRILLAGGEFVWGCAYASRGFAVVLAAF